MHEETGKYVAVSSFTPAPPRWAHMLALWIIFQFVAALCIAVAMLVPWGEVATGITTLPTWAKVCAGVSGGCAFFAWLLVVIDE